jgi:hypothetical protein
MFVGNEEVLYQPSDNRITLYPCRITKMRRNIMNKNEFYQQQAETLGEFFKHHRYNYPIQYDNRITRVPSQSNYALAIKIMKQQGEKNVDNHHN